MFSSINEKGELTVVNTKLCLLACCTTWKVCFLTTNYGYNKFADLCGSWWPFAKPQGRFVFLIQLMAICCPDQPGLSYWLSKQTTCSFAELKDTFLKYTSVWRICDYVHALILFVFTVAVVSLQLLTLIWGFPLKKVWECLSYLFRG